jgi:3-oxoacyl-[acyl-carrier-protein] synthase II
MSQSSQKRVVVTGLGVVSPLGNTPSSLWENLSQGRSGVRTIQRFDSSKLTVQIAAEVPEFNPLPYINSKEQKKMGLFIQYGVVAAIEALKDAKLISKTDSTNSFLLPENLQKNTGVSISAGMGGLPEIQFWDRELLSKEKKVVSPFFVPMIIPNLISGHVSILTGAKGPNLCIATACSSSAHAIGESFKTIQRGDATIMVAGGAEAVICELGVCGFASMRALSTRNDSPEKASRPYDKDRDGFVLGEGSAVLILEELEHAQNRGAPIYAELIGYGLNADAFHMTSPSENGEGARSCMHKALNEANLNLSDVDYLNTHGTSTTLGDIAELKAIYSLSEETSNPADCRKKLSISSTKSMTGHLLGAAGALEALISILTLKNNTVPPTINLENIDEACKPFELNLTPQKPVKKPMNVALSNSFGFGGTNASLVFRKEIH